MPDATADAAITSSLGTTFIKVLRVQNVKTVAASGGLFYFELIYSEDYPRDSPRVQARAVGMLTQLCMRE